MANKADPIAKIEELKSLNPSWNYDWSKAVFLGSKNPIILICPRHGEFTKKSSEIRHGKGCPKCGQGMPSQEEFIAELERLNEGKNYDFSKAIYKGAMDKVLITCPIHGEFEIPANRAMAGAGCQKCAKQVTADALRMPFTEAVEKIGDRVTLVESTYKGMGLKVTGVCNECGHEWEFVPSGYLQNKANHPDTFCGCPVCSRKAQAASQTTSVDTVKAALEKVHPGKFKVEWSQFRGYAHALDVQCNACGHKFKPQLANMIRSGTGCPECAKRDKSDYQTTPFAEVASKIQALNSNLEMVEGSYSTTRDSATFKCSKCGGTFKARPRDIMHGGRTHCQKCEAAERDSMGEREVKEFIRSIYQGPMIENSRSILEDGKEIDIYLPDANLAIEYNGLYYHCDEFRDSTYHLNKTRQLEAKGIRLIHLFEDEWEFKSHLVKSKLNHILGNSVGRIYARKCNIVNVSADSAESFLNDNHIQGYGGHGSIRIGLEYEGVLVAIMTLVAARYRDSGFEILRYATSRMVTGGFSKLLGRAEDLVRESGHSIIVSYSDKRWSSQNNNVYLRNGFTHESQSKPSYWYFKGVNVRYHRSIFQKHKLEGKLPAFDSTMTEVENMKANGWKRIFDCGTDVWVKFLA